MSLEEICGIPQYNSLDYERLMHDDGLSRYCRNFDNGMDLAVPPFLNVRKIYFKFSVCNVYLNFSKAIILPNLQRTTVDVKSKLILTMVQLLWGSCTKGV